MSWEKISADKVPLEKRIEIIDVLLPQSLSGNPEASGKMSDLYNEYIAPKGEELDMFCGLCVAKVQNKFLEFKQQWIGGKVG